MSYTHLKAVSNEIREKVESKLGEEIVENEPKTFKILKSYYKTCMNGGIYSRLFIYLAG